MLENKVRLTQTVQKGGCAAKVAATELREILCKVKFPQNSAQVIVDGRHMDDAGVIKINNEIALVQTLDFFTPIVDSPYLFGQIAAANSLSDVYAMGGIPKSAMAILAFPLISMDKEIIVQVLQGASDKIKESKADFVGGHSIDDDTLKFGLSVTGYVHPEKIWSNAKSQSGDRLILTKPIGTGTATAALKKQNVIESDIQFEIDSMIKLNNILDILSDEDIQGINAATDITGFGLAGHSIQMARASQKTFSMGIKNIPVFKNTMKFLSEGYLTKAHRTNLEYIANELSAGMLSNIEKQMLCDPQTSGGLLLSVSSLKAETVLRKLNMSGIEAKDIGFVSEFNKTDRLVVK